MIMVKLKKMSNLSRVEISCACVCVAAARGDVNIEMQRFGGWARYNCTNYNTVVAFVFLGFGPISYTPVFLSGLVSPPLPFLNRRNLKYHECPSLFPPNKRVFLKNKETIEVVNSFYELAQLKKIKKKFVYLD